MGRGFDEVLLMQAELCNIATVWGSLAKTVYGVFSFRSQPVFISPVFILQVTNVENLSMPCLLSVRNLTKQPVTLLDLCYGKTSNLNLQQVSALESKLSQLLKHLHGMRQTLGFILAPGPDPPEQARKILAPAVYARLLNHASRCNLALEECCPDLLTLSLIVPSAPWVSPCCWLM
ncbi:UNVERIFIED_CONTAM: hypothetical protein FKN15_030448 [Acipenser sinensis]